MRCFRPALAIAGPLMSAVALNLGYGWIFFCARPAGQRARPDRIAQASRLLISGLQAGAGGLAQGMAEKRPASETRSR